MRKFILNFIYGNMKNYVISVFQKNIKKYVKMNVNIAQTGAVYEKGIITHVIFSVYIDGRYSQNVDFKVKDYKVVYIIITYPDSNATLKYVDGDIKLLVQDNYA